MRLFCIKMFSVLVFVLILFSFGTVSGAADVYDDIFTEGDWIYKVNSSALVYNDYNHTNVDSTASIIGYRGSDKEVTVPAKIGEYYIEGIISLGCCDFEKVVVSKGIINISEYAFLNCVNLREVLCNDSMRYIGKYAFQGCVNLDTFVVTGEEVYINDYALRDTAVKVVLLPNDYHYYKNTFPPHTHKATNYLFYYEYKLFRLLPYELFNFSLAFFIVLEVALVLIIIYLLKKVISYVLGKCGISSYYSYQRYCKKHKDILHESDIDSDWFRFQKRKKRFVFLRRIMIAFIVVVALILLLSLLKYGADYLKSFLPKMYSPWSNIVSTIIMIFGFVLTVVAAFFIYWFFQKKIKNRDKIFVKKYLKGDSRYDS